MNLLAQSREENGKICDKKCETPIEIKNVTNIIKPDGSCCTVARPENGTRNRAKNQSKGETKIHVDAPQEPRHNVVAIPGGRALLGTDRPHTIADEEGPLRQVRVKPFWIDATVVTNARFAAFVAATNYVTEAETLGDSFVFKGLLPDAGKEQNAVVAAPWWRMVKGANWRCPAGPDQVTAAQPDDPVVHVSWNDACAFGEWAGGRLPTEAEWEHAARGGRGDVMFPWGDDEPNDTNFFPCNIWQGKFPDQNTQKDGYLGVAPARSFAPNGYGLYNMAGNVWEWTSQIFKVKSLRKDIQRAHEGKRGFKITKGGSFLCHVSYCFRYRIAARTANSPDSATSHQGFRLVYDRDPQL